MKPCVLVAAAALLLSSCAPRIITQLNGPAVAALAPDAPVLVLDVDEYSPNGCALVANVFVGESGTTLNCGLDRMMSEALRQARQAGGNVLKLTELRPPSMASTCYQITGEVFYAPDLAAVQADISRQRAADEKPRLPAGTPYALLYVYRPTSLGATALTYDVRLNDSVVYQARFGSRSIIRLTKPGAVTLWTENGGKPLTLEVEPGKEYYLRCGLQGSTFKPRPWLSFVSTRQGRQEYDGVD
ncbi:hypothetical protein Q5H92_00820 [Hymenobacter sp. M29]|uniref:Lipoprotein n=1 Tax=Hymenobacter mellowenesis TaxID=3063995 RepID=A0ABT9A7C5_9BACT|nr:hypothetical protein [Hymenobacter sp. M29]MDO7844881.1 hypothetical protein [Hymenobacter sp. M29]